VDELLLIAGAFDSVEKALAAATSVAGAYARHGGRIEAGAPADLVHVAAFETLDDLRKRKSVWKNGTRLTNR
jgi:imidazolonepropionase-like amidohydrolase